MQTFLWIPGTGPDPEALKRLTDFFPMPPEPMGVAWFLSEERYFFYNLCNAPISDISLDEWERVFREITSGIAGFGHECDPMWRPWFFYLLGRLIPSAHEYYPKGSPSGSYLWECLVSAFMAEYPAEIEPEPYPGFRDDIFSTLARVPMSPQMWKDGKMEMTIDDCGWDAFIESFDTWFSFCGGLSSAMFFCLKYMPVDTVDPWVRSAMAIKDPYWIAQMIFWLVGYHRYRTGDFDLQPKGAWLPEEHLEYLKNSSRVSAADISWEHEEHLGLERVDSVRPPKMTLITEDRALLFEKCLGAILTKDLLAEWRKTIEQRIPEQMELKALIGDFSKIYLHAK